MPGSRRCATASIILNSDAMPEANSQWPITGFTVLSVQGAPWLASPLSSVRAAWMAAISIASPSDEPTPWASR